MITNLNKTDIVISISNLNVIRGKIEVLANFDLEINKGSVTGLLGPSGCGKTTLMRSIVEIAGSCQKRAVNKSRSNEVQFSPMNEND